MSEELPDWLQGAVGGGHVAALPTVARLGSERALDRSGFSLGSPAFKHGGELDPSFTACEEDAVAPPLEWTAPPPGSQELVLIVEDIDHSGGKPQLHWLVWGFAPQRGKLMEGEVPPRTGKNGKGNSEWLLPDPPLGEQHRYLFQLFALELPLTLMPGASYDELVASMEGYVTACAVLAARFEGHEVTEWEPDAEWEEN